MSFPAWRGAYLTRSLLCGLVCVASVLAIVVAPLSVVDAGAARGAEARSRTGGETLLIGGYGRDGVVRVDGTTGARRTILAMTAPTAMIADRRRGTVYVASELSGGRTNLRVLNRAGD